MAKVGETNGQGAICRAVSGPVEMWVTERGDYIVYLRLDDGDYLYKKREIEDDAERLFQATDYTVSNIRRHRSTKKRVPPGTVDDDGYECLYEQGPLEIWKSPKNDFVVYLVVRYRRFRDDLYNTRGSLKEAEALLHSVRRLLYSG